jgi:hypothetical protein
MPKRRAPDKTTAAQMKLIEQLALHCAQILNGDPVMLISLGVQLVVTGAIVAAGGREDRALTGDQLAKADSVLALCERRMRMRIGDHPE